MLRTCWEDVEKMSGRCWESVCEDVGKMSGIFREHVWQVGHVGDM